jgi:hypothetical protein
MIREPWANAVPDVKFLPALPEIVNDPVKAVFNICVTCHNNAQ